MPSTNVRNMIYRSFLPFCNPKLDKNPSLTITGTPIQTPKAYLNLLRKHHVLGSATLIKDASHRTMLLCSSSEPKHVIQESSLFRVASITKMVTSLVAMIAVEQKKLDLDQPILSFFQEKISLPDLQNVTLRHLLSHTSGLTDPPNLEKALLEKKTFPELLSSVKIASVPGSQFHYSNLGFGLIGCMLEAVYQEPVSDIFHRLVFSPLFMHATLDASALSLDDIVPICRIHLFPFQNISEVRKTELGNIPLEEADPLRHYGHTAGAMYIDLPSLEKLVICLMNHGKPLLKTKLGVEMTLKHSSYGKSSPTLSYGLGILRIDDPSISSSCILGHQGFAYGCADGAFWQEGSEKMLLFLNGGASEARKGRLGLCNYDILKWAFTKEMTEWY